MELGEGDDGASGSSADVISESTKVIHEAKSSLRDSAVKMANEAGLWAASAVRATPQRTGNGPPDVGCGHVSTPRDYGALVGTLQIHFGQYLQLELLHNELTNRSRKPGEPLRILANDIESLTRRAYAHMPSGVQVELVWDLFIRALSPTELRVQVQLQHPQTQQAALELAVKRENVWGWLVGAFRIRLHPLPRLQGGIHRPERGQHGLRK